MALIAFLAFSILLNGALGELVCKQLPVDLCSYSVSTSGKRCLLENYATNDGIVNFVKYQCKTSEVVVDTLNEWIETDECITACGLNRNTVGVYLPNLCANPRRAMYKARSNGDAARAPLSVGALSPELAISGVADVV